MNLHGIVSGAIGAVNPPISATLQQSTGYTTNPDGSRTPAYSDAQPVSIQVQALTASEIRHLDSLNIQGVMRAVYFYGDINGLVRPSSMGGDLVTFNGQNWLIVQILESWPDWTKAAIALQQG